MGETIIAIETLDIWLGIVETEKLGKRGELNMGEMNK